MCFEASQAVFWSLSCYKELKLITKPFTGRTLRGLLIQMQNISLRSSGMRRKQNFEIVFGFKSDTAVLTFTFRFLSSLLFSLFLPHFFFLLLGIQQASFWWEKFLGKLLGSWDYHDDVTSGRKDVDLHGRLRGEWVMDMINQ